MTLRLKSYSENEWRPSSPMPKKFEPGTIYTGMDDGNLSLEVCVGRWTGATPPTKPDRQKVHADRQGQGFQPVVVAAVVGSDVYLFGPNAELQLIGPLSVNHAERILQAALNESSGLEARKALSSTYDALASTPEGAASAESMLGVGNVGLFASHELRVGVRRRPDWENACAQSKDILGKRDTELVKALGYEIEGIGTSASLLRSSGANARALAIILQGEESWDGKSNRFEVSPVAFGIQQAVKRSVPWLVVLRKSSIRLYPARQDIGVGRKGGSATYFELNLDVLEESSAGFLSLIFSCDALADDGTCWEILKSSAQYAVALGSRLRENVYGSVVPDLALAVASQFPLLDIELDREGLDLAYQVTLRIFFRMMFQAYADDLKLLPFGENEAYTANAIKGFAASFVEHPDLEFDEDSTTFWDDLTQVWRAIDVGSKRFGIPAYNGGLFSSDPELHPEGALIDKLRISDEVMGPVLRAMLIDTAEDGTVGPIDFRSLSVREFGTIYEGLLESNLAVAEVDLVLDDDDVWVPLKAGKKVDPDRVAEAGDIYFHDTSGARKGTGSYFTPSFVVEHLIERSLVPALANHLEGVATLLETGKQADAADKFFDFKVADLAMGSAHFLTAAIDYLEQGMAGFLESHPIPGITNELRRLEEAAMEKLGPDAVPPEPRSLLRRQIARRCIYGLDINPVAVELARVSIWIHTFVRGLPMSSLDHTLVCANSLTGIGTVEELMSVHFPERKKGEWTLFDDLVESSLNQARDVLIEVSNSSELDSKEARASSRATQKAKEDAAVARLIMDAAVLKRIGHASMVGASDGEGLARLAARKEAQDLLVPLQPAHLPFLFPEVFMRQRGGFDVLIGNPPWEKLHVEEHQWWGLRMPGLRGMPMAERTKALKKAQSSRPDLVEEYQDEIKKLDAARSVIASGPYPGIGAGHIDLYKAFAWRNWHLTREGGSCALVLPRGALNGSGTQKWRREVIDEGSFADVVVTINTGNWVFANVDGRYTTALVAFTRGTKGTDIRFVGPFANREEFETGRDNLVSVPKSEFLEWTGTAAFPLIPDSLAGEIFRQMRKSPSFSDSTSFEFRPVQGDLNAATNKDLFNTNLSTARGETRVLTGSSFNLWSPDFGDPYAMAGKDAIAAIVQKTLNSSVQERSAFHGLGIESADDLPMMSPRIAFRDVTNATNTRTMVCCLVPGRSILVHPAPYLVRRRGTERDEAFLLGVLSSRIFDWYARRIVELHLTFELLDRMPIPECLSGDNRYQRLVHLSGRLAAVDSRYATWAKAVGVPVGSVSDEASQRAAEAEIDALVAHLYGLTAQQLDHLFKTFHRGWNYTEYLALVMKHFVQLGEETM